MVVPNKSVMLMQSVIVKEQKYLCITIMYLSVPHNKALGSGSFGAVFTHVDKTTQQVLAVKKVDLGMVISSSYQKVEHMIPNLVEQFLRT